MSYEFSKYVLKGITDIVMGFWVLLGGVLCILILAHIGLTFGGENYAYFGASIPCWMPHTIVTTIIPILYFGIPYVTEKRREFYKKLNKEKKVKKK